MRELLSSEEAQYLQEAVSTKGTPAERIAKMRQKAKRIREEKESEHARLVQEKYDQRFRRDCAELRELQSRELDFELGNEHLWQMKEKFDRKKDQQVEEQFWTDLWYKDIAKKQEREDRDLHEAKSKSENMAKTIREQMQAAEQERIAQKGKRKEYSEAAVNFIEIHRSTLNFLSFSGHNFELRKMKNSLNIKKNFVNKKSNVVFSTKFLR